MKVASTVRRGLSGKVSYTGQLAWLLPYQVCTELDLSLEEVAAQNIAKLFDRLERGVIGGEGDVR